MPTTISTRPGLANFTDNPSRYFVADSFTNANQKFQVRVYVDDPGAPKVTLMYPPYLSAVLSFSINDIVRPYINFYRPKLEAPYYQAVQAAPHSALAWIDVRVFDPGSITQPAFTSDIANKRRYIKGGYGLWNNLPNFDFEDPRKWFFTWQPTGKLVAPQEAHWLLYCHPVAAPADLEYYLTFTDGTTATRRTAITETDYNPADRQFDTFFIPTGIKQCSLDTIQAAKQIFKYRVRVLRRSDSSILATFDYRADYRPNYNAFVLYYRNSLGGWESQRILGEWEEGNSYTRKEYQREIFPDYSAFNPDSPGATPVYDARERRKWKANTGHLGKSELDSFRDLLLSKEMAIIKNGAWIPVSITTETLAGLNTRDGIQNITLEFQSAFDNKNYTPDTLPWKI